MQYTIRQRRAWTVSGLNHPSVPSGQIGVFTHDWNRTSGNDVLPHGKHRAREVVLWKNRVVSNRPTLSDGRKIRKNDRVLIGVGPAAAKLKKLKPGKKITLSKRIEGGQPTVAISGDRPCWSTASGPSSTTASPTRVRRSASTPTAASCSSSWSTGAPRSAAATPWSSSPTS